MYKLEYKYLFNLYHIKIFLANNTLCEPNIPGYNEKELDASVNFRHF